MEFSSRANDYIQKCLREIEERDRNMTPEQREADRRKMNQIRYRAAMRLGDIEEAQMVTMNLPENRFRRYG